MFTLVPLLVVPAFGVAADALDNERIVDATRFRSTFGLQSDETLVRSSFVDPAFSSDEWGVPLSDPELDDLALRTRQREAMNDAASIAMSVPESSGVFFDQKRGGLATFLSKDPDSMQQGIASALPKDVPYIIVRATRTYEELQDLKEVIVGNAARYEQSGGRIVGVGIYTPDNAVRVTVAGSTEGTQRALTEEFGDSVRVRPGTVSTFDACSSMVYCWPMKGGIRMFLTADHQDNCTTGFLVRRSDNNDLFALTAGHCLYPDGMPGSDTWGHAATPSAALEFGWEQANTFFDYSRGDVGLVKLNSAAVSALGGTGMNLVHIKDPSTNVTTSSVQSSTAQHVGDPVCRMGWGTWDEYGQGQTCGTVSDEDNTNISHEPHLNLDYHIQHTWEVDFDSLGGDSGGPITRKVIVQPQGFEIYYAYGTHVHSGTAAESTGWYTPINMGQWQFSLTHGYSYNVCTGSAC